MTSLAVSLLLHHYVYLFALDDGKQIPHRNHTFATFVETSGDDVRAFTINWLPASKVITTLALGPERGMNFPASDAFDWAKREGLTIAQWGPYEIKDELYAAAEKYKARLDGGMWYRVLDDDNRIFKVLDPKSVPAPAAVMCVHAISDIVDDGRFLRTGTKSGIPATELVAWHLKPFVTNENVDAAERSRMERELALPKGIVPKPLVEKPLQYCRTLEECRE